MKKTTLFIVMVLLSFNAAAQGDSLRKLHAVGVQLDFGLVTNGYNRSSQQQLRARVPGEQLLDTDLSGFEGPGQGVGANVSFPGHLSGRVVFGKMLAKKNRHLELFLGFRYGNSAQTSAYYSKGSYDTTGTYVNQATGRKIYTVDKTTRSYDFSISAKQVTLPFGLSLTSDKNKRVWLSTGVELSPGLIFSNSFSASSDLYIEHLTLDENSKLDRYDTYTLGDFETANLGRSKKHLGGTGFTGRITLPQAIYIRLSRRIPVLDRMNFMASLSPGFYMNMNKYTGNAKGLALDLGMGLRYNL